MARNLKKDRRIEVEAQAWALSQQCWSQARIAVALGVDQSTISRALDAVRTRVMGELDDAARTYLFTILGQLEHAADEAMQAWERSKRPKKRASNRAGTITTEVTEREGEPAFLTAYFAACDRMRSLLRLDIRACPKPEATEAKDTPTVRDAILEAEAADAAYQANTNTNTNTSTDGEDEHR